ncbi:MAG: hypothetical protein KGH55_02240 [Nanoarchaeota archaeon]|nr:hypothetical protein [Nanoarchaeota archaeon]
MIRLFNSKETREVLRALRDQFGIQEIPGRIIKLGEEKLFLFTGDATEEEIQKLERIAPVERLGVYFAKQNLLRVPHLLHPDEKSKQNQGSAPPIDVKVSKSSASRVGVKASESSAPPIGIRLSIEGSQILKNQIKKNTFELDEKQAEEWMSGRELNIRPGTRAFLVMKYKNDFLGCGKASEEKISNFIPKMRRLKNRDTGV